MARSILTMVLLVIVARGSLAAAEEPTVRVDEHSYGFAALSVSDLSASAAWYQRHFGVAQGYSYESADGSVRILVLSRPGLTIELQQHATAQALQPPGGQQFLRLGIFKFGVTVYDLRDAVGRLRAAGARVLVEPFEDQGGRYLSAIVEDNSGNLVQLFQTLHR